MTAVDNYSISEEAVRGAATTQEGDIVMPFYIVVDTSGSMGRDIDALTAALIALQQMIADAPEISDIVRVCIIEFDSEARVLVPLGSLEEAVIPTLRASGGTSYPAAFRTLKGAIDADTAQLRAEGLRVYRALTFFLTDGEPNQGDWEAEFARLFHFDPETGTGYRWYPRFIPFGFRDARLETLAKIAYPAKGGQAFVQSAGARVEDAFAAIMPFVGRTMIATGLTGTGAAPQVQHVVASSVDGFTSGTSQYAGGDFLN